MNKRATICALLAVFAWSTVATAFKIALRHLDQFQLLFLANVFSLLAVGLVLVFGGRWKKFRKTSLRQLRDAALLGLINPVAYYLILLKAYSLLPAQIAQPLNYTWALTLGLLSVPLLGQRLTKRDIVGGLICYFGVVVISTGGKLTGFTMASPLGIALALGSTIIWAFYWLGNTRLTQGEKGMDPVVALFVGFAFSLPVVALIN
ncbi:MAG: drug/metabolite transporter (DMT)-like permease, partial [Candidatus Krumholzibacteriia bacterium]